MKKVLLISYFWPYCSGSKRTFGLAKYLPEFGWEPIVLTGPLESKPEPQFRVIETKCEGFLGPFSALLGISRHSDVGNELQKKLQKTALRRNVIVRFLYNKIKELLAYPDEYKGWRNFALRAVHELLSKERVDAILSIWPLTSHCIAHALSRQRRIPWIADFPDLWSDNAAYGYSSFRRWFERRLEKNTLHNAHCLTTSSPIYKEKLKRLHPGKAIQAILMGFDPAILNIPPVPLTETFTVTYTGMLYEGKRTPTKFFKALSELIQESSIDSARIEVRFYGPVLAGTEREIADLGLSSVVKLSPSIPLRECLQKQRESHVLLQLNWEDPNDKGVFSGKMLDYLAAMRPILAAGGTGSDIVQEWLSKTGAGLYCQSVEEIKAGLLFLYQEYIREGSASYRGNQSEVEQFSQKAMAKEFAQLLDSCAQKNQP